MRTPANIARHPIHPMLVPLPIGLWVFSLVCDIAGHFAADPATWKVVALYTIVGGIVGALLAAVFGFIDVVSLPAGDVRKTGFTHMGINLVVVVLYCLNAWLRLGEPGTGATSGAPLWLSIIAIALLVLSGWLGGKMVYTAGVAVDTESLLSNQSRR